MSEELQLEEQISQELVKQNVTQAVISGLKEKYAHLKISGIEDKETYLLVKEGRKECKAFRVLAKKICEKGREDAVAIQKAWVKKQKEVTDEIAAIEDPLEEQEREYEAAVAKEKEERKRRQEEQLIMRQQVLTGMGALYSDGSFHLGEVSFELSVVKESEPDIWEESILPKFKEEYEKVEAERIEQERVKREQEAEMKRQQDELERKKKELEAKEAALMKAQNEQQQREEEEKKREADAAMAKREAKNNARMDQLFAIGLKAGMEDGHMYYKGYDCYVSYLDIMGYDDEKWDKMIMGIIEQVSKKKEEEEQKRLAAIEAQKEAERKMILGQSRLKALKELGRVPADATAISLSDLSEEEYDTLYTNEKIEYEAAKRAMWEAEQEEKRKREELLQQQKMEQAKDKEKWDEILRKVNEIEVYEMRSSQYRKKAMILREKFEEIKAL
jgi:hypothetical protein